MEKDLLSIHLFLHFPHQKSIIVISLSIKYAGMQIKSEGKEIFYHPPPSFSPSPLLHFISPPPSFATPVMCELSEWVR